jgi:hypothetical protein
LLIVPNNWREFQHYKDRNPPWIRLHRKLLDNKDFHRLPVASRALAPMLWLLASESVDGVIDADPDTLAFRLRSNEKEIAAALRPLMERGFFHTVQVASNTLAECKHNAVPETEAETEAYTETEKTIGKPAGAGKPKREPVKSGPTWEAYTRAYLARYRIEPVRNAQVNSQMAQFVAKLDLDDAPLVAEFYVAHNDSYYVRNAHKVGLLLRDVEKLRTEWATGRSLSAIATEPAWRTEQRQRTQLAAPGVAVQDASEYFLDMEPSDVTPRTVGGSDLRQVDLGLRASLPAPLD